MDFETDIQLKEFIRSFGASLDSRLWINLIKEEVQELREALLFEGPEQVLKETADVIYVLSGFIVVTPENGHEILPQDEIDAALEIFDEAESILDTQISEMFAEEVVYEAFKRVHESNMSKLDDNGKPIKREDGKVLKGPNYKAPDLSDLVGDAQ